MLGALASTPSDNQPPQVAQLADTAELLKAFLSGRSEQTIKAYAQDLAGFASFISATSVEEAAQRLLGSGHGAANRLALAYRTHLVEKRLAPATVNRRLAALRSLVQLARTFGLVPWTLAVQGLKVQNFRDTRGPGVGGVRALLEIAGQQRNQRKAIRDRLIVRLLFDLGLRASELTNLDLADYQPQPGTLAVKGKGQLQKTILTLPEPTKAALQAWLAIRGEHPGPLVGSLDRLAKGLRLRRTSLYRLIHGLGLAAGLNTRAHGIRHAAITAACERAQMQGVGLEQVLDFSRHSRRSIAILMVYRDKLVDMQGKLASLVADAL